MARFLATSSRLLIAVALSALLSGVSIGATTQPAGAARLACHPLTNSGNCYEPGEFCRHSDRGKRGVAGDGKRIVCRNNDGLRWEPY